MNPLLKVIGLMSGTSLDGLDVALVEIYETRGNFHVTSKNFKTYEYDEILKNKLLDNINPNKANLESISDINFELGDFFAKKVLAFCSEFNINSKNIDLIGSHGHTFYHNFKNGKVLSTLQLADISLISQKTGITTVGDFRPADIAVNGQGAPLVPFVDYLLFKKYKKNIVLQNIGGISNFTFIPSDGNIDNLMAFDSGPGNMIIDSLIKKISNGKLAYDKNGDFAKKGNVNKNLLADLLNNPYFSLKPPKSTGRELFGEEYSNNLFEKSMKDNITHEDLIATVTFFTAQTIYDSYKNFLKKIPDEIVVSGGGAKNLTLMNYLKDLFGEKVEVSTIDKYGITSDSKEAVAFAILAYCNVFGIPNNEKNATGAEKNVVLGKIAPSDNFSRVILKKNHEKEKNHESTEELNIMSEELDLLTPYEIVELMNISDYETISAIENSRNSIASVITKSIECILNKGKIFYIGAGTSGRLGVLDASECPPTFKTNPETVQGIIAGGSYALTNAVEGAEDVGENGRNDVKAKVSKNDILIGISANGKAPYVIDALEEAKSIGAKTALLTCNNIEKKDFIDDIIYLDIGSEVLSGSTRLKSGTVTKMVLNMITTGTFAKTGKVYGNYMIDLKVSNKKLKRRGLNIIKSITKCSEENAIELLEKAEGNVKNAILMQILQIDYLVSQDILEKNNGFLRDSLN